MSSNTTQTQQKYGTYKSRIYIRGLKINLRKSDHALYKVVVGLHKLVLMRGIICVGYEDIIGSM